MKMREYETLFIFRPDTSDEEVNRVVERVKQIVDERNGLILQARSWGKRKLAYEIEKHMKGIYFYARYIALGDTVHEIERNFKMIESVIKYQTVKIADDVEKEARAAEFKEEEVILPAEVVFGKPADENSLRPIIKDDEDDEDDEDEDDIDEKDGDEEDDFDSEEDDEEEK